MRSGFGPTRLRASATKLRGTDGEIGRRLAQAHPRAHEVERGAAGACELARRRPELARLDAPDCGGELRFQVAQLLARERRRHDRVRTLEELVDDLDVVRTRAEACERVHEPLQPVALLDDRFGRQLAEQVRLVIDDEGSVSLEM